MKFPDNNQSRRSFLKKSILTSSFFPLVNTNLSSLNNVGILNTGAEASDLKIHVFSKHLQFLNYNDMAEAAAEMGFDGIDLTVRPEGHVEPARVKEDLPKAVEAIHKAGLSSVMMTTAVDDVNKSTDKQTLETAARLGIKSYRMNWLEYPDNKTMPETMLRLQQQLKDLSLLNKKLGLTGCYQNHAGNMVGSSMWELWELLRETNKEYTGVQYDIRHAVVEGGMSWQNGLRLIYPQIKTIAIKDFKWEKKDGKWIVENTPIGEGMVDFKTYFTLLKQYRIQVPVSMHYEYPLEGGVQQGTFKINGDKNVVFKAMKRDLNKIREIWKTS